MYWFIVLFPILIYPWGIDPYYTTTKANYLFVFILCYWLYIFWKKKQHTLIPEKGERTIFVLLIIFLCLIEISTAFSKYTYTSVHGTIDRKEGLITFFSYCSMFLFSYRLIDVKKVNRLLSGIAVVSIVVSIYAILQHYSLDFLPRNSAMRNYSGTYTFFDNPNFFGSYLVLIFLLSLTVYLAQFKKNLIVLYYITICLAFFALLFSNTRSAYLGIFCGAVLLTVFVVYTRNHLWKRWAVLAASLLVIALIINFSEKGHYLDRASSILSESYSVVTNQGTGYEGSSRLFIWVKSLPLIKDYFWFGSGPDTFEFIFPATPEERQTYLGNANIIVDKVHNEYLQIAITLGAPTLFIYLLFLFLIVKKAIQAVKKATGREQIVLFGLISTVIGYLIQAFFNISTVPVAPIFWSILGVTLAKAESHLKNNTERHKISEQKEKFLSA
ncbi:O-antigen ligase family protein [Neobacillus kokaensis]|uniref:O-antigen ligase family protein n=1 Tax=Neobacillus kokaensis TaxID=2759023 RepID=UPI00174E6153|nr:O-antigen ligase family protein [Neobacillus kokaensis]